MLDVRVTKTNKMKIKKTHCATSLKMKININGSLSEQNCNIESETQYKLENRDFVA